ncbi:MAG: Zn-dependent exopeptidase M28, partial [Clostridiales bacterium]|nr:Zn-dependent exopeptidase M28 [Clostridiales bacterium]
MKRILAAILLGLFVFASGSVGFDIVKAGAPSAVGVASTESITDANDYLERFLEDNGDRTSFTEGEVKARARLKELFTDIGFTDTDASAAEPGGTLAYGKLADTEPTFTVEEQPFTVTTAATFSAAAKEYGSANVVARLPGKADGGVVIIGAHYDNTYGDITGVANTGTKGVGAYDNGTGIAVMLSLAEYFYELYQTTPLDFSIEFVAYGASMAGGIGSQQYVTKRLSMPSDRKAVLLAVNLDCVGAGDY